MKEKPGSDRPLVNMFDVNGLTISEEIGATLTCRFR